MTATTGVINGTMFLVYLEGTAIAYSTSCTLSLTSAARDVSSKTSAGVTNREYGKRDWSVSGDALYQFSSSKTFTDLMSLYTNRTKVTVRVSTETASNKYYEGEAVITSLSATFPSEENSTYSYTFEGDGAITEYTGT
jgi:predicted secreted protein